MHCLFLFSKQEEGLQHMVITLRFFASQKVAFNFVTTILENAISCGHSLCRPTFKLSLTIRAQNPVIGVDS